MRVRELSNNNVPRPSRQRVRPDTPGAGSQKGNTWGLSDPSAKKRVLACFHRCMLHRDLDQIRGIEAQHNQRPAPHTGLDKQYNLRRPEVAGRSTNRVVNLKRRSTHRERDASIASDGTISGPHFAPPSHHIINAQRLTLDST